MSEAKFTKGEWLIVVNDVFMDDKNLVVSMDSHIKDSSSFMSKHKIVIEGSGNGDAEAMANAHLIAAAPKMYKEIERDIEILTKQCANHVLGSHELRHLQLRIKHKRMLLAKARGEQ